MNPWAWVGVATPFEWGGGTRQSSWCRRVCWCWCFSL